MSLEDTPEANIESDNTIKVCPECDRPVHFKNKKNNYKCYSCGNTFRNPIIRERKETYSNKARNKKQTVKSRDIITRKELLYHLKLMQGDNVNRDRAFISFIYITASRISEVVGLVNQRTRERITEPIKKYQIEFKKLDDEEYVVVSSMPILKRKLQDGEIPVRNVPIYVANEMPFIEYIKEYMKDLEDEDALFSFTDQTGWRISRKIVLKPGLKGFNHYWRHLRLTHLAADYGFQDLDLQQLVGWANTLMASKYTHLNWQTLARKMKRVKFE